MAVKELADSDVVVRMDGEECMLQRDREEFPYVAAGPLVESWRAREEDQSQDGEVEDRDESVSSEDEIPLLRTTNSI